MTHSNIVPPNIRGAFVCAAAVALCGCAGSLPPLPNDDVRAKLATAGIIIHTNTGTTGVATPLHGWAAVGEAAKQGIAAPVCGRDPCRPGSVNIGGGGPLEGFVIGLAIMWIPVGAAAGAVSGALNSHSEQQIETASAAFRTFEDKFEPDKVLQEQLEAAASRNADHPRMMFVNSAAEMDMPAQFKNVLTIDSSYSICSHGKISPDVNMIFSEEAILTDADSTQLFHRRWELVTHSMNYFDAMADDAKLLRAEFDTAYGKLAERMANDLYVKTAINGNRYSGHDSVHAVAEGDGFETCY